MNFSPRIARAAVAAVALAMIPVAGLPFLNPVELQFYFSSDAPGVLNPAISKFNAEHRGQIEVTGTAASSGKIEGMIAEGDIEPEMWMPASSTWGRLLNFDAQEQLVPDENPSYFYSPEVFASWKEVDEQINQEIGPMGWTNLFQLNQLDVEEGEEGPLKKSSPFRFGHTRATTSTSGLYSVVSQYAAVMGTRPTALGSSFNSEDMRDREVVERVKEFEMSVRNYSDVADDFCPTLGTYSASSYSAVYMQETSLLKCRFNEGVEQLLEIHPEEGSFVADYPFIILSGDWVEPDERAAAEEFRAWLEDNLTDEAILGQYFRAGNPWDTEPDLSPTGADEANGTFRPVPIPDVDVLAQARLGWEGVVRKMGHVVILLDHSGRMNTEGRWADACVMLQELIAKLDERNHVGVVTFDDEARVVVEPERIEANDVLLENTLDPLSNAASPDEAQLSDGILTALDLPTVSDDAINLLIVVSTGQDDSSELAQASASEAIGDASSLRSPVQVFTVFMGDAYGSGKEYLASLASAGKGKAYNLTGPGAVDPGKVVDELSSLVPVRA